MLQLIFRLIIHQLIFCVSSKSGKVRGKGSWKHNSSLRENSTYMNSMKKNIISSLENLKNENITDDQNVQEYLQCKRKKKNFF